MQTLSFFKGFRRLAVLGLALVLIMIPLAGVLRVSADHGDVPESGIVCTTNPSATFTLTATGGSIHMTDGNTIYTWSYAEGADDFQFPGPVLCVNEGDNVTVVLHNALPEATSMIFPGQMDVTANGQASQPQFDGLGNLVSLAQSAPANGGTVTYSFVADRPGTYFYQSGTNPQIQVQMGLYGALIVRPALGANFLYNDPASGLIRRMNT